ncbi:HPr family phosphocarrier protein [Conyzicola nivalis]|uniref:Phosphocarrier protein HPr n=1 Tax=Conyzicola nivalis TaxID=1477021 RepID=A0A916WIT6_9MICO|nr:HPr family phosphocarrier protein [Conyzicola nivalis]GGB04156.1 phosphotransferase [Conyzicola nivalis]
MPTATVIVGSTSGLHARPASLFSQAALASGAAVTIAKAGGTAVNAASILGLLTLGVGPGEEVTLTTEGDNADAALESLSALLKSNLDEQ